MKNTMIKKILLVLMSGMMIVGLCAFAGVSPVKAAAAAAGNPPANPPENPVQPQNVPQQEKPAGEPAPAVSPEPAPEPEPVKPKLSDSEIAGLKEAVRAGKDARISSHVSVNRMPSLRIWRHSNRSLPGCFAWQRSTVSM